jgi:outer membrane protein assembly factor BamD
LAISLLTSCNSYNKLLKSNDPNAKLRAGEEYFDKADYAKVLPLLEDVVNFYRGTKEAEKIYYELAYSYMKTAEYTLAAYEFKTLYDAYPLSAYAEDSRFYYAYCLYLDSPASDLDQSNTQNAINSFQVYLDRYPDSKRAEECNKYIDILQAKLEKKTIDNALLYYKIENYKSAVWALRNAITEYPATKQREYLEYLIVRSAYLYADRSVFEKQQERYTNTLQYYYEFKEKFPNSTYAGDADRIARECKFRLSKINKK